MVMKIGPSSLEFSNKIMVPNRVFIENFKLLNTPFLRLANYTCRIYFKFENNDKLLFLENISVFENIKYPTIDKYI